MAKSITVKRKKRGRPATGTDPLVGVRIPEQLLESIDRYARDNKITRSEVMRQLLEKSLKREVVGQRG